MKVCELKDLLNKPEMEQYLDCEIEFEDQMSREYESINTAALTHEHYIDYDEDEYKLTLSSRRLYDEEHKWFTIKRDVLYTKPEEE